KITVSHSQTVVTHANTLGSAMASTVVKTEPTSTMNITGLRHSVAGLSLRSASGRDFQSCLGSSRPPAMRLGAALFGEAPGASSVVVDIPRPTGFTGVEGISGPPRRAARARAGAGRSAPR